MPSQLDCVSLVLYSPTVLENNQFRITQRNAGFRNECESCDSVVGKRVFADRIVFAHFAELCRKLCRASAGSSEQIIDMLYAIVHYRETEMSSCRC